MSAHLERGRLLVQQGRAELGEQELRRALADNPDDANAHALLALALSAQQRLPEALKESRQAVQLAPDWPFTHYVLAHVLDHQDDLKGAHAAISEAIRLDPTDADFLAKLASIHLQRKDWKLALEVAEQGLQYAPEHVTCNNMRATALLKLGRRAEAGATLDAALAREPENATTHANRGWSLLEASDPQRALEHFREALRLQPNHEYARAGIVEALKAHNVIYRQMLRYFLWMSRLKGGAQWGVILGAYFGVKILGAIAKAQPALAIVIYPVLFLYLVFTYLTWTASPLFNLLLRLNRFGRYALSRDEIIAANCIGLCLLFAIVGLLSALAFASLPLAMAGVGAALLVIPVAGTFRCETRKSRLLLTLYTLTLILVGLAALVGTMLGIASAGSLVLPFFLGILLFTWLGNLVINRF